MTRRPPRRPEISVRPRRGTPEFDAWSAQRADSILNRSTLQLDRLIGHLLETQRTYHRWISKGLRPSDPSLQAIERHIQKYSRVAEIQMKRIESVARGRKK